MKNRFYGVFVCLVLIFCCTACNGTVTRDIRHAGFNVGSTFECSDFFPENKDDISYKRVRYFTANHIIASDGEIYEQSLSQKFTNNQNCKKADTSLKVKAIFDEKVFKASDNKYYALVAQNDVQVYQEIPSTNTDYNVYNILLKDEDVIKVKTIDSTSGMYYVLKSDGNVYAYVVVRSNSSDHSVSISSTQLVYNRADYGANIIDFNYAGDSLNTYIRTENKVYRMKNTNSEECSKYVDVKCEFSMKEDSVFEQYNDRIISFNGSVLITDYKQVFNIAS